MAALVYRQAKHAVQVFAWPAAGDQAPELRSEAGYTLIRWTEGGMAYWAIADIAPDDLAAFVRAFRAAG